MNGPQAPTNENAPGKRLEAFWALNDGAPCDLNLAVETRQSARSGQPKPPQAGPNHFLVPANRFAFLAENQLLSTLKHQCGFLIK